MTAPEDTRKPGEDFFSRWSQRKQQAREEVQKSATEPEPASARSAEPAPPLPPVESLTPESDYTAFLHPKVNEDLRRSAMKKLFSDPHFNVMDGLDIYIDDYSISEPIPAAMLKELKQAQNILEWARERKEDEAARERQAAGVLPAPGPAEESLPALEDPANAATAEAAIPQEARTEEQETVQQPPPDRPQTA